MVGLEETERTPLATSVTQLVNGAVNLIMTARLEALATPSVHLASAWPKTVFGPVVSTSASPTVAILLWAVKGEMVLRLASEAELPILVLLGRPGLLLP